MPSWDGEAMTCESLQNLKRLSGVGTERTSRVAPPLRHLALASGVPGLLFVIASPPSRGSAHLYSPVLPGPA